MNKLIKFACFIFVVCLVSFVTNVEAKSALNKDLKYLRNRINPGDNSFPTWISLLKLMRERQPKVIVEIRTPFPGRLCCTRDLWSSIIFSDWACCHKAQFFSVCSDPEVICNLQQVLVGFFCNTVNIINIDPIQFINNFPGTINCFWLDTFNYQPDIPCFCRDYYLRLIKQAYPKFNKKTIIIINDCVVPTQGEGLLVIDYLRHRGWKIHKLNFQVILIHE